MSGPRDGMRDGTARIQRGRKANRQPPPSGTSGDGSDQRQASTGRRDRRRNQDEERIASTPRPAHHVERRGERDENRPDRRDDKRDEMRRVDGQAGDTAAHPRTTRREHHRPAAEPTKQADRGTPDRRGNGTNRLSTSAQPRGKEPSKQGRKHSQPHAQPNRVEERGDDQARR